MLAEPTSKNFPASILAARKARGWTQKQFAEAVGIDDSMPTRYERGKVRPKPKVWMKLNAALFPGLGEEELKAAMENMEEVEAQPDVLDIKEATVEQLIQELKSRGFSSVSLAS